MIRPTDGRELTHRGPEGGVRGAARALLSQRGVRSSRAGYSIIELLLVVAVLAVLSALAFTQLDAYTVKSKRTEAILGLGALRAAQRLYYLDNGRFADRFDQLAFDVTNGQRINGQTYKGGRYTYVLSNPTGPLSYRCTASADLDGDSWPDVLVTQAIQDE